MLDNLDGSSRRVTVRLQGTGGAEDHPIWSMKLGRAIRMVTKSDGQQPRGHDRRIRHMAPVEAPDAAFDPYVHDAATSVRLSPNHVDHLHMTKEQT
jgi:hypothetical protein